LRGRLIEILNLDAPRALATIVPTPVVFVTSKGTTPYLFGRDPIEFKEFEPADTKGRLERARKISPELMPKTLTKKLGAGGQSDVYAGKGNSVLKFGIHTIAVERLVVIQEVLKLYSIPHLPLDTRPAALQILRQEGIAIQERIPAGTINLHAAFRGDLMKGIERRFGKKAVQELEDLCRRIDEVNEEMRAQGYERGYNVSTPDVSLGAYDSPKGQPYEDTKLIDEDGRRWPPSNIFYHPKRGFFLIDW
jgi:hypothetical protein